MEKRPICSDTVPDSLLTHLENREVVLWIESFPKAKALQEDLVAFISLPWRMVFLEHHTPELVDALERSASSSDPLTKKRGFVQVIDTDPTRFDLPQRSLPIYLLSGRSAATDFEDRLRRLTMLERLRRSEAREILVVSAADAELPPAPLREIWASGFRSYLTFASDSGDTEGSITRWLTETPGVQTANLVKASPAEVASQVLSRYRERYPEQRKILRIRDQRGSHRKIDITDCDEPERPILDSYSVIEERDLSPFLPEELSEGEFIAFFRDSEQSWRPYAAGLPWIRERTSRTKLQALLRKLDASGAQENCIAYIASESGAGGTTLARSLAWECAKEGYPTLVANQLPFVPDALPIANFLTRIRRELDRVVEQSPMTKAVESENGEREWRRYETPWIIVFDYVHWQYRDGELVRFRNELEKSGRPVCLLVVTGTQLGLSYYNASLFHRIAELNHALEPEEALQLGDHLNKFMRVYGKQRSNAQWEEFYRAHTVRYLEGIAAFWVTLSFWIQGQYDLSESIQEWMYRTFKANVTDKVMQRGILAIAALSSERLPLPEALLPTAQGKWPLSYLLDDARAALAAIGLVRISEGGSRHWALVHDILGRFLLNAVFYDTSLRTELGLSAAKDAEHLRFSILRELSRSPTLGERAYRSLGEDFATAIFKIDPDHGRGSFAIFWREVLVALDEMPRALRDTSRVFRHHTAVSRRRIAKLDERLYGVKLSDRITLLARAIQDITYALSFIEYTPGSESNINLLNSLANAYLDLAEAESHQGAPRERITELRQLANDATRRAYFESPTNSFVIETYVKNLLEGARDPGQAAIGLCIEALGILFSALLANEVTYRRSQLGDLAEQALAILFKQAPLALQDLEPVDARDVLVKAWSILSSGMHKAAGLTLSDVPNDIRFAALNALQHPAGRGNMQVIRLTYDLSCLAQPFEFKNQLQLIEQLQATDFRLGPQLRLEYAILLFQNARAVEGDKVFRSLRRDWRDGEHFVQVPDRLRWLLTADGRPQTVHAVSGSDHANRAMARVTEFGNSLVPFRPEEHGIRDLKPGFRFVCHVSFGYNGPFLRPTTAGPARSH